MFNEPVQTCKFPAIKYACPGDPVIPVSKLVFASVPVMVTLVPGTPLAPLAPVAPVPLDVPLAPVAPGVPLAPDAPVAPGTPLAPA